VEGELDAFAGFADLDEEAEGDADGVGVGLGCSDTLP
jgi:hypothetical protein